MRLVAMRPGNTRPARASGPLVPILFAIALAGFVVSGLLATAHGPERPD
jgi:hypothetical protein